MSVCESEGGRKVIVGSGVMTELPLSLTGKDYNIIITYLVVGIRFLLRIKAKN
jgi:hypothetical protein